MPAQVRREAERVNRELESVMRPLQSPGYGSGLDRPQQAPATAGSARRPAARSPAALTRAPLLAGTPARWPGLTAPW